MTDYDLLVRAGRVFCAQSGFDGPRAWRSKEIGLRLWGPRSRGVLGRSWIFRTTCSCRDWWICTLIRRAEDRATASIRISIFCRAVLQRSPVAGGRWGAKLGSVLRRSDRRISYPGADGAQPLGGRRVRAQPLF